MILGRSRTKGDQDATHERNRANLLLFSSHGMFFSPKIMRFWGFRRNAPLKFLLANPQGVLLSRWSNIRELLPKSLKLNIYGDSATFPLDNTKPSVLASHFDLLDVENSSAMMFSWWRNEMHFSVTEIYTLLYQVCACVCIPGWNFTAWLGRHLKEPPILLAICSHLTQMPRFKMFCGRDIAA